MIESKSVRMAKMALLTALGSATIALVVQADAPPTTAAKPSAPNEQVDPKAKEALSRMTDYLKTLQAFTVYASTTRDELVNNNFKVQKYSDTTLSIRKPDRLRADVRGENGDRSFVYDGKTLVVYNAQPAKYYATMPAPATIQDMMDAALKQHGIELPLVDLVYSAMGDNLGSKALAAGDIGPSKIGDADCEHYAVRSPKVDWQIWIERGDKPLPRKIVLTTRDDPTHPQYAALLTWDVSPHFDDKTFSFTPPEGAKPIAFAPKAGAIGGGPKSTHPTPHTQPQKKP